MASKKISHVVVARLAAYRRALRYCKETLGKNLVSSLDLADMTEANPSQVRKDLSYFGEFGIPGRGYDVKALLARLDQILNLNHSQPKPVALVGVGNLGQALLGYPGFARQGFDILAAFDRDHAKVGKNVGGVTVQKVSEILSTLPKRKVRIGILAVPADSAQEMADLLCDAGVRAIINFAPVRVRVPSRVKLRNVDLTREFEVISYYV